MMKFIYSPWTSFLIVTVLLVSCADEPRDEPVHKNPQCQGSVELGDTDIDGDDAPDRCDNCVRAHNTDQLDVDFDGIGDVCDLDVDGDDVRDGRDICPDIYNAGQQDSDEDGAGDVCDYCPMGLDADDSDGDGFSDCVDLCAAISDPAQLDADRDGVGDACDNCPGGANASQGDLDEDGVGDACESADQPFEFAEAGIADIHRAILSGGLTCEVIIDGYLQRIARFDLDISAGAPINAFVMFNESVREQARRLDARFSENQKLVGPLHCVPIAIKTNFDSSDTTTTNGSFALEGTRAPDDGFAVGRMRAQGAILIGTTAMDEFARGIQGIGGRHGKTGNAYDTAMNSGGSSAGSGSAVAASFVVGATGTDNCGSLSVPAAYQGLVTIRSTLGLVSLDGIFPSSRLDAVAGPLARSVRDMALMLDAMATRNPQDPRHDDAAWSRPESYVEHLDPDGLRGRRIGVLRHLSAGTIDAYRNPFEGGDAHTHRVWKRALADLERLGAEVVENVRVPGFSSDRYGGGWVVDVDRYLETVDSPVEDFDAMCRTDRFSQFVYSGTQACLDAAQRGRENPDGSLEAGREAYAQNRHRIEHVMDLLNLDALVYPADAFGAANRLASKSNCIATATSGLPAVVVPAGLSDDEPAMPIGIMFMGRRFDETRLIEIAYAFEQGTGWRRAPELHAASAPDEVPRLDLGRANGLRRALGNAALDAILADGNKFDLRPGKMRDITRAVLEDAGYEHLFNP
jgi:aspartyl-tRNA(Asn)/glutamyl-tRNA(Gln) amidotransferase subunit A